MYKRMLLSIIVATCALMAFFSCSQAPQSSGYDMLDQAAMKAVRNWRFTPAKRGGEARTAWVDIPVMFTLNEVDAAR